LKWWTAEEERLKMEQAASKPQKLPKPRKASKDDAGRDNSRPDTLHGEDSSAYTRDRGTRKDNFKYVTSEEATSRVVNKTSSGS